MRIIFPIVFFSSLVFADLPECHPDYAEWLSVGAPVSWTYSRQCKGDTDGLFQGSSLTGYMTVFTNDLSVLIGAFKIKEPPEGPGLYMDGLAADFDHKKAGSPYVGYYRVGTSDACILASNFGIKEPPKGPGVPADCTICETPGSGLQGPQLSLWVSQSGGAFQDTVAIEVNPNTLLKIGINNTTADIGKCYDGYIAISGGHVNGVWTGNGWVYDPAYFQWTYFGTSPLVNKDTWYLETIDVPLGSDNPSGVSSWAEYLYNGEGNVTFELYDEFFELADTLTVRLNSSLYDMEVLSPNGQEILQSGKALDIVWNTVGQVDAVDIDYSLDGGNEWASIVSQTANDGLYHWNSIPAVDSDNCLIRISDSFNPTYTDTSDTVFTIFICHITPLVGDFNGDCYVNLADFAVFCENWLLCGNAFDPLCTP